MNKNDLIFRISNKTGYGQKDCSIVIDTAFNIIKEEFCCLNVVQIKDFGTLGISSNSSENKVSAYFRVAASLKKDVKKNLIIRY